MKEVIIPEKLDLKTGPKPSTPGEGFFRLYRRNSQTKILPDDGMESPILESNIKTVTSNYSLLLNDFTILVNALSGNVTITFPDATDNSGKIYNIKKIDSSGNLVILLPSGTQKIDGYSSQQIANMNTCLTIITDGVGWFII